MFEQVVHPIVFLQLGHFTFRIVYIPENYSAIAAGIVHPERRILAIAGDAGFMMNVQDIETAARLKLNVVWMVWCDSEYGLIKWKQQNQFGGKHSELKFTNPDFAMMAKSFGIWGRNLTSAAELKPALEEAFQQDHRPLTLHW